MEGGSSRVLIGNNLATRHGEGWRGAESSPCSPFTSPGPLTNDGNYLTVRRSRTVRFCPAWRGGGRWKTDKSEKGEKKPGDSSAMVGVAASSIRDTVRIGTAYAPRRQRARGALSTRLATRKTHLHYATGIVI